MKDYKKVKGWSGNIYWVEMTEQEVREREEHKLIVAVPVTVVIMTILFMVVAGYKFF